MERAMDSLDRFLHQVPDEAWLLAAVTLIAGIYLIHRHLRGRRERLYQQRKQAEEQRMREEERQRLEENQHLRHQRLAWIRQVDPDRLNQEVTSRYEAFTDGDQRYGQLAALLAEQNLVAANEETLTRFFCLINHGSEQYGTFNPSRSSPVMTDQIVALPAVDLLTMDRLWRHHSGDRFGFSIQHRQYVEAGRDWSAFCERVGWDSHQPLSGADAPIGHHPSALYFFEPGYLLQKAQRDTATKTVRSPSNPVEAKIVQLREELEASRDRDEDRHAYGRELAALEQERQSWKRDPQRGDFYRRMTETRVVEPEVHDPHRGYLVLFDILEKASS
jgi:hypothetical protein